MIEPGVNPRKWIHNCNRNLSKLITDTIDDESEWLTHLQLLKPILSHIDDFSTSKGGKTQISEHSFFYKFLQVRQSNKMRLIRHLQRERKDPTFLADFDLKKTLFQGQLKKITKSSRNLLLVFYCIKRYFELKSKAKELAGLAAQNKLVPRIIFVGGISRPGDKLHLMQIKFIINVANVLE